MRGGVEDPDDALRRLESMGSAKAPGDPLDAAPLPPAPVVDSFSAPPTNRPQRPMGSSQRAPRSRTRPAAGPSPTRIVARIAFPVVFLVAVIALIGIVVQSGVMSSDQPATTPTTKATKAGGSTTVTKKYVVKSGDSLSTHRRPLQHLDLRAPDAEPRPVRQQHRGGRPEDRRPQAVA